MSSKTGLKPWSMGRRMALWYAGSASVLLFVATAALYWTIAASLDAEADEFLKYSVDYLSEELARNGRLPETDEWGSAGLRVIDADGREIFSTPSAEQGLPPGLVPGAAGVTFRTRNGHLVRALARRVDGLTYQVAYDRTRELGLLGLYRRYMVFVLIPALAASAVIGILIARRGLRPVGEIAATARRIGPERLGERIAAEGLPAELDDLARTFNIMLDRLQESFVRLERFSGDIAHELRSPVHSIRTVAEIALETSQTRSEDREALATCLDSAGRLSRLIERLLFLARADDPRMVLDREEVDVGNELGTIREFYEPAAAEAGIALTISAPAGLRFSLERALFQRAIGNLLTNALTHTMGGGQIRISASLDAGALAISVADTGTGIAPEHLSRLFDRFYRVEAARTPGQGIGLGLAIVRSIVELHGGRASIVSAQGEGTTMTMRFPPRPDDEIVISP